MPTPDRAGWVYLALGTGGARKIGMSECPTRRRGELCRSGAVGYEHLIYCTHARWLEKALHARFAEKRLHGEWFDLNGDDVKLVTGIGTGDGSLPAWLGRTDVEAHALDISKVRPKQQGHPS